MRSGRVDRLRPVRTINVGKTQRPKLVPVQGMNRPLEEVGQAVAQPIPGNRQTAPRAGTNHPGKRVRPSRAAVRSRRGKGGSSTKARRKSARPARARAASGPRSTGPVGGVGRGLPLRPGTAPSVAGLRGVARAALWDCCGRGPRARDDALDVLVAPRAKAPLRPAPVRPARASPRSVVNRRISYSCDSRRAMPRMGCR